MAVFTLKVRDTRPILEVALKNPDGSAHDLTGTTAWKLHIQVSPTVIFTRDMAIEGPQADGILRYTWQAADWDVLPTWVRKYQPKELEMEYEVFGGAEPRQTFPNGGYDILRILGDVGIVESKAALSVTLDDLVCTATATVS